MDQNHIATLLEKALSDQSEFVNAYLALGIADKEHPELLFAYADCLYELERDGEAIETYLNYASRYPEERGYSFAIFGAAMALKNMGLEAEALELLEFINPEHENLDQEIVDCKKRIDIQIRAIKNLRMFKLAKDHRQLN